MARQKVERGGRSRLPRWVPYFNAVAKPLLALGVPIGPDILLTVPGRRSGLPRTTPVAICDQGGRRGFISPFGETNWAGNLRAAGRGTIRFGRRREEIRAVELDQAGAFRFIKEVIAPSAAGSKLGDWFVRHIDRIDLDHPEAAAVGKPVFEIFPAESSTKEAWTSGMTTHQLETPGADIVYDVHGPLPAAAGRPVLFMIGQPMDASGFNALASHFHDRTVVTYDPRGLGRSIRKDGRVDHSPAVQAGDVHAVIGALGTGPVEMFASSGGAVTALALVAAYPNDVTTLVAHEPPLFPVLPDAEAAERARAGVREAYQAKGRGAGMAAFIAMTSWRGEFSEDYFARAAPDPAQFGMPADDDGSRDDPLLSDRSWAVSGYRADLDALAAAPTRIVIAVGEESTGILTGRTSVALAGLLGQDATVFPSHHGGFLGAESGYPGQPEAFARKLREVLERES